MNEIGGERRTRDGHVLTPPQAAALEALENRLSWPSLHWGVEGVSEDAWPHLAVAAADAAVYAVSTDAGLSIRKQALADAAVVMGRAAKAHEDDPQACCTGGGFHGAAYRLAERSLLAWAEDPSRMDGPLRNKTVPVSSARVVPRGVDSDCITGLCPKDCSHLMWYCPRCTSEGGWGMGRELLKDLASRHQCAEPPSAGQPGCEHCPDGHRVHQPWNVHVAPELNGDGQPIRLIVQPSAGAHVAQSDADWIWGLLNQPAPKPAHSAGQAAEVMLDAIAQAEWEDRRRSNPGSGMPEWGSMNTATRAFWSSVQRRRFEDIGVDLASFVSAQHSERLPVVDHKGPHDTDASMFTQAADRLEGGYELGGSNLKRAVVELIRREVLRATATPESQQAVEPSVGEVERDIELSMLRELWGALGCGQNPNDFRSSVRLAMWGQAMSMVSESTAGDTRLARENQELEGLLAEARAAMGSGWSVTADVIANVLATYTPDGVAGWFEAWLNSEVEVRDRVAASMVTPSEARTPIQSPPVTSEVTAEQVEAMLQEFVRHDPQTVNDHRKVLVRCLRAASVPVAGEVDRG